MQILYQLKGFIACTHFGPIHILFMQCTYELTLSVALNMLKS